MLISNLNQIFDDTPPQKILWGQKVYPFLDEYNYFAKLTWQRRLKYFQMLDAHLKNRNIRIKDIQKVCLILSSSRSGSSLLMHLLGKQACTANDDEPIILNIQSELRPHIISSGFYPLLRGGYSDQLDTSDLTLSSEWTKEKMSNILKNELLHEIGYSLPFTTDLYGYAIQIYGRLILQWPEVSFEKSSQITVNRIFKSLSQLCQHLYKLNKRLGTIPHSCIKKDYNHLTFYNNKQYLTALMVKISQMYPKIDLRYYDGICNKKLVNLDNKHLDGPPTKFIIEETPFIIPKPRHFATAHDLKRGILILKDPSIIWQIEFWQSIFKEAQIQYLHLTRDPRAVINGLIDGWNSPVGFQTHPVLSPLTLNVKGYSDQKNFWKSKYINYSSNRKFINFFHKPHNVHITEIAALQYAFANRDILDKCKNDDNYWQIKLGKKLIGFEWLITDTINALTTICNKIGIRATDSVISAAINKDKYKIMVTKGTIPNLERWKTGKNKKRIIQVANLPHIKKIAKELGYQY